MGSGQAHQPDQVWLRAFRDGERSACGQVARWARDLVRDRRFFFDEHEVDDIVQETVIAVWRICAREDFRIDGSLRPLVRRIAAARCIDRLRRRRPGLELDDRLPDGRPSPYDDLHAAERRQALLAAVQALRPVCRDLIRWRIVDELPFAEIGARLGCAEATARVKMFQCKQRILAFLEARGMLG